MPQLSKDALQLQREAINLLVRAVFLSETDDPGEFDEARMSVELAGRMLKRLKGPGDESGRNPDWWPVDCP